MDLLTKEKTISVDFNEKLFNISFKGRNIYPYLKIGIKNSNDNYKNYLFESSISECSRVSGNDEINCIIDLDYSIIPTITEYNKKFYVSYISNACGYNYSDINITLDIDPPNYFTNLSLNLRDLINNEEIPDSENNKCYSENKPIYASMSYRNNTKKCVGYFVKKTYLKETIFTVECNYNENYDKYNLNLYECKPTADNILLEDYGQYTLYKIVCNDKESLIAPGLSIGIYQDITELSNIQINEQKINYNNYHFSVLLKNESSTRVPSFYLQNSTHILYGDCQIAGNNKKSIECSYNNFS
jgi:hypothetical protein